MKKILVYDDYTHNNSILLERLCDVGDNYNISLCSLEDIQSGVLTRGIDLFVMPGGADLYYCERLDGAANARIKSYVEGGGAYLGICAGAYYGAANLRWAEREGHQAICDTRELAFTNTTAVGPIYEYLQDRDFSKSWTSLCRLNISGKTHYALYRGGCYFESAKPSEVLATYEDGTDQAAILRFPFGKGKVVLSGPHIELRAKDYAKLLYKAHNPNYDYCYGVLKQLEPFDREIDILWKKIVSELAA